MVDEGAPEGPVFFLSYARARRKRTLRAGPQEPDGFVMRLFDDLSKHVDELIGAPTGVDPGFVDRGMESGTEWSPELVSATARCQVFVPLISPTYLTRPWCAMEWDGFTRRQVVRRRTSGAAPANTAVLPVLWLPTPESTLPARVRGVHFFEPLYYKDPDISSRYSDEGVYGLLTMEDQEAYKVVAWRLARRIAEVYQEYRVVVPDEPPPVSELRTSFAEPGDEVR